ncbi:MAG: Rieske (2Fe-2S) protein [Bacteroidales bacterium]|jgi:nitrite reductase/ring-hydroxylating ferredoxin subunit|nr:Rieske (2Fe-2S) protein [Bacteroidales bacterium]
MKHALKFCTTMAALVLLLVACNGYEHETIPNVRVNFTIYPDNVNYYNLNYIGGHEYFTGGVAGIIVYRIDGNTFVAYDRACPHDWEDPAAWLEVDESGIMIVDNHCGSRFNILDGSVIQGPSRYNLRMYHTSYDGRALRIYS